MYEETIAGLRKIVQDYKGRLTPYMRLTICKAADAIEELQKLTDAQLDIIKQYQAYLTKRHWIPTAEQLPEGADASGVICENVNLLLDDGLVTCGWMNGITGKVYYLNVRDDYVQKAPITRVTHWMPLPEPPKEET